MLRPNHYIAALGYTPKTYFKEQLNPTETDSRYFPDSEDFCPAEFWDLDQTLSLVIYSYLSYFRENVAPNSYPNKCKDGEEWLAILDKMIAGFAAQIKLHKVGYSLPLEERMSLQDQFKEGFDLLYKYYPNLWV